MVPSIFCYDLFIMSKNGLKGREFAVSLHQDSFPMGCLGMNSYHGFHFRWVLFVLEHLTVTVSLETCQKQRSSSVISYISLSVTTAQSNGHICNVKIQSIEKLFCHVIDSLCVILFKSMGAKPHFRKRLGSIGHREAIDQLRQSP